MEATFMTGISSYPKSLERLFLNFKSDYQLGRGRTFLAAFLTGAILICHMTFLGNAGGLWRDEVGTIEFSKMTTVSEIWNSLQYDNFPPMMVFALRAWKAAGLANSDLGYRTFGLLVGFFVLSSIWLTSWLVCRRAPILALLLFGLHPYTITIGDSIRPYGMGIAFIVMTIGFVWKTATDSHWRWFVLGTVTAVASVQTLYHSAFVILAICMGGFLVSALRHRWKNWGWIAAIGLISALSLIPYHHILGKGQDYGIVGHSRVELSGLLSVFFDSLQAAGWSYAIIWISLLGISLIGGIWVLVRQRSSLSETNGNLLCYFTALGVVTSILYFGFLIAMHIYPQRWYFLLFQAVLAIAIDSLMALLVCKFVTRMILGFTIILLATSIAQTWKASHERRTNIDRAAEFLQRFAAPSDCIIVDPFFFGIGFKYYYRGQAPWTTLPAVKDVRIHRFDLLKETMQMPQPIEPVLKRAADTLAAGGRVWLLGSPKFLPPGIKPETLPPAPQSRFGWMLPVYLHYWSLETSFYLTSHTTNSSEVAFPSPSFVQEEENSKLYLFRGWKDGLER